MHIVSSETEKTDWRQLPHMTNTWDICWEVTGSSICDGGKQKSQRRVAMWQTLPGYQNIKTRVKTLILTPLLSHFQYYWDLQS